LEINRDENMFSCLDAFDISTAGRFNYPPSLWQQRVFKV